MSSVIDGDKISAAKLISYGPRPSMPSAFVKSSLFTNDITWPGVIIGICKKVSPGNLLFVKCWNSPMTM